MYSYTRRKNIASQEAIDLPKRAYKFMAQVENALYNIREEGEAGKLYLTQANQYRLLTLKVWMERYRVDLEYILWLLIPFWEKFLTKKTRMRKSQGLNVRVATLVGKKSESLLKESLTDKIQEDFRHIYISLERERLYSAMEIRKMQHDRFMPKKTLKHMLDYKSPVEYAKAYTNQMKSNSLTREAIETEFMKRPYRGNPFREETV